MTWLPSSSFTLISSLPQSKFFQRQVLKYILFNVNTGLNNCSIHVEIKIKPGPHLQVHVYISSPLYDISSLSSSTVCNFTRTSRSCSF